MDLEKIKNVIDNKKLSFPEPLKLNLQFFADGGAPEDPPADPPTDPPADPPEDKSFSQSEVDSAISKAVDKALKNKEKEFEKEKQRAIDEAKKDAADYAKLTKQQQQEKDYEKRQEKLDAKERELNLRELRSEVESDLKEKGLPAEFAGSLVQLDDNEKIKESITNIKKTFDEAVNAAVKEKLRQDTPPAGNGGSDKGANSIAALRNKKDQKQNKAPDLWA
ncbi:DUF4355 domain-containing protein [Sediminibacillus massiliensis]|uniref:DUF4355 domain-containing protein n=1 Tax=Sediminibacillus massiliensis TaxID=1926277 RepID=UPI000988332C|nr:DUF4355 domain-containing protein [Sediminibacillus massiliensis]